MRRLTLVFALITALALVPSAAAWTWPLGGDLLRPYSLGPDAYAAGQHRGVDVAGEDGESVRAPASGTVSFAGVVPGSGRTVTIQLDGYAVSLTHLGAVSVVKGATVAEGQTVGIAGPSGDAEWPTPYVHLGIRVSAAADGYVDPATLLPPRPVVPPPAAVEPVVAPVAAPVVAPVTVPVGGRVSAPVVLPVTVPVSSPGPAPGSSLASASGSVAANAPRPSPSAAVSPREPVSVEAPLVPGVGQPTITADVASTSVQAAPGDASTARRPPVGTRTVTAQSEPDTSLAPGSPPAPVPPPAAVRSADASPSAPAEPAMRNRGIAVTAAPARAAHGATAGVLQAVAGRRNPPLGGGIDVADRVDRVTPALLSGGQNRAPQVLPRTAREGSTTTGTVSLLQRGRRLAVAAAALLLVALGTIWLLARIRRLDSDGVVPGHGQARLGRRAPGIVAAGVGGSDRGRLS